MKPHLSVLCLLAISDLEPLIEQAFDLRSYNDARSRVAAQRQAYRRYWRKRI